ncbi:Rhodanese-related sulfurtransferase [Alteromonadaceae bacterium Bs31]|nr:Rhodanese-related sulfurtransferase [Alteromonadaceae bacterium Bs31]
MGMSELAQNHEETNQDLVSTSSALVPLKALKHSFLSDLFARAEIQNIFENDIVFNSGVIDHQHVFLLNGEVELVYSSGHTELIRAAEQFQALAHHQPRTCRAQAKTDCTLLRIDSDQLDRSLSWCEITSYLFSELALERDYDEDVEWMQTVLNSNLFLKVPPVNVEQIFDRLTPMVVLAGEVIVRQGELGDCCYFIKDGDAQVTHFNEHNKKHEKIVDISIGRCFGEDALVFEAPRNANVVMKTDGVLMRLEKSDFMLLLKEASVEEVEEPSLEQLSEAPILIDVRTDDEYNAGHLAFSGNIPLSLLSIKKRLLSQEKLYVFYCDTGRRSRAAAFLLGKQGYNVMSLKGGINGCGLSEQLVTEVGYIIRDGELLAGQ